MRSTLIRRFCASATVAAAVVGLSAGCSSSGSSTSTGSTPAATPSQSAADAALFPNHPATGSPIKIGVMWQQGGQVESDPASGAAALAAIDYANASLGGIDGHKIVPVTCESIETIPAVQDCANKMVQAGVSAFYLTGSIYSDDIVPIITKAGIPYITDSFSGALETSTPGVFSITSGVGGTVPGVAEYAKEHGMKNFTAYLLNVPNVIDGFTAAGNADFKKVGVGFKVVPIPQGSANLTPQIEAGLADNPGGVLVVADPTTCISAIEALKTSGTKAARIYTDACYDPATLKATGNDQNGSLEVTFTDTTSNAPSSVLARAVMAKYAPGYSINSGIASFSYQGMISLVEIGNKFLAGAPTAKNMLAAMRASKNVPIPMLGTATLTCNGKQVAGLPNACSPNVLIGTWENGQVSSYQTLG